MKKVWAIIAVAVLMGVGSSRAQTTNLTGGLDIAIAGKLIPSGALVTGADLTPDGNTNTLSFVHLEIIDGTTTNLERWIGQIEGTTTNLFLRQRGHVDFTPSVAPVYSFLLAFEGLGQVGTTSNATLLVTGKELEPVVKGTTTTNYTINAKVTGIWLNGTDDGGGEEIAGTLTSGSKKK